MTPGTVVIERQGTIGNCKLCLDLELCPNSKPQAFKKELLRNLFKECTNSNSNAEMLQFESWYFCFFCSQKYYVQSLISCI